MLKHTEPISALLEPTFRLVFILGTLWLKSLTDTLAA